MRWTLLSGFRLLERRSVWWPTLVGWCALATGLVVPALWWVLIGESFLSSTQRLPAAPVLVIEGWIGREGVHAAASEFEKHCYSYLVTSGGPASGSWERESTTYAEMAGHELMELGVPRDRIIMAPPCKETESRRTFESAAAVWRALRANNVHPKALDVFTYGPHAKRSRLVFAKIFGPETSVGAIAWRPAEYRSAPWWQSSQRAKELIAESVGYFFELLLNSGRLSNTPDSVR